MSIDAKLAIHEMIARYSYTYDGQDADGFAQLFVEDGVFEIFVVGKTSPSVRLQSRREIREWATRRLHERNGRFTSRHYQSGILFDELSSDSARTRTMVLVTHQGATEPAPRPTASGVYYDRWRKTSEGWRLAQRAAHVDRDPGFSKWRRHTATGPPRSLMGGELLPRATLARDGARGEAFDHIALEVGVEGYHGQRRQDGRSHQLAPQEDVAEHQVVQADGDRLELGVVHEDERVEELVPGEREREERGRQDAGRREREDHARERTEPRRAVHHRRLFEVAGDRPEEAHQEPGAERDRERRVRDEQCPEAVDQVKALQDRVERDEEQGRRDEVHDEHSRRQDPPPGIPDAGQAVAREARDDHGHERGADGDERAVLDPGQEVRRAEERGVVPERRRARVGVRREGLELRRRRGRGVRRRVEWHADQIGRAHV